MEGNNAEAGTMLGGRYPLAPGGDTPPDVRPSPGITRRRVLLSAAAVGAGGALSGCHGRAKPRKPDGVLLDGHSQSVEAMAVGRLNGKTVAVTGGSDGAVRVWDLAAGKQLGAPPRRPAETVSEVVLGQLNGKTIAVVAVTDRGRGRYTRETRVWDLAAERQLGAPLTEVVEMAVGQLNGKTVAVTTSSRDHAVRVWDLAAGSQLGAPLTGHTGVVSNLVTGQMNGTTIAVTSGHDNTLRVWDLAAGRQLGAPLKVGTGDVLKLAVGQLNGKAIAVTGSSDGTVHVRDLATWRRLGAPLTGGPGGVMALAVGQLNGKTIAVTGSFANMTTRRHGTVRVWDLAAGKQLGAPLTGHTGGVRAVAIDRLNGRTIAVTASEDDAVRVWDLAAGKPLAFTR